MTESTGPGGPKPPGTATTDRRGFLARGAAALALPYFIAGSVRAQGARPAPSERLTIASIGYGNQGSGDVGTLMNKPQLQYVACSDVRSNKLAEMTNRLEGKFGAGIGAYGDWRALVDRDDIDLVHIATPDHWHGVMSCWLMASGKDIYCQKPLSLTVAEAWAIHETAQRFGRVFQTGSQQRSSGEFLRACEYVRSGRLGEIKQVNVQIGGPSEDRLYPAQPVPPELDWDMWLGPAPWMPYNEERASGNYGGGWRQVKDYSGGMMTDWGAHHFDITQWGLGKDGSGPDEILAPADTPEGKLVYVYTETEVGNNVRVVHQGPANGVRFIGELGEIEVNRGLIRSTPESILEEPLGADAVRLYASRDHFDNWLDCVVSREAPITDSLVGASSVTMCHLGNIAHWSGRSFRWDPGAREIIADPELSRFLSRPMRAPWHL